VIVGTQSNSSMKGSDEADLDAAGAVKYKPYAEQSGLFQQQVSVELKYSI